MRRWCLMRIAVASLVPTLALALASCGGDQRGGEELGSGPVVLESSAGGGIVTRVSGVSKVDADLPADKGAVTFDVQHIDRLVNQEVSIELQQPGGGASVGKTSGNEPLTVDPGTYDATLIYRHSRLTRYEGTITSVEVHPGRLSTYKVKIEAPVGFIDLKFLNDGVDVRSKVTYTLYPLVEGESGPERGEPLAADLPATEMMAVPAGTYDVLAVYQETESLHREAWLEGIVVEGGMARTQREFDYAVTLHGFIMHALNFGEDVSDQSKVYFYQPGANVEFAVAQDQGDAGKRLVIKPGIYDVRVVYQPSPETSTWGDKVIRHVVIKDPDEAAAAGDAAGEGAADDGGGESTGDDGAAAGEPGLMEMEVDLEKPLARLQVSVSYGDLDVSDKAQMRIIFHGADKVAASAVYATTGLGTHIIPAGEYDIEFSYKEDDLRGSVWLDGVKLEHGDVWEQSIDLRAAP